MKTTLREGTLTVELSPEDVEDAVKMWLRLKHRIATIRAIVRLPTVTVPGFLIKKEDE